MLQKNWKYYTAKLAVIQLIALIFFFSNFEGIHLIIPDHDDHEVCLELDVTHFHEKHQECQLCDFVQLPFQLSLSFAEVAFTPKNISFLVLPDQYLSHFQFNGHYLRGPPTLFS